MRRHSKGELELHVIVPGICGPVSDTSLLENNDQIARWVKSLSRSSNEASYTNIDDAIRGIMDIGLGEGDLPTAALTMCAQPGFDEHMYYMHAAPVHLQADMDHAVLTPATDISITDADAAALCGSLNQHFEQDGLHINRLSKEQWIIGTDEEMRITTTSLSDAVGRNINFLLPQGDDSGKWKKILTEAQMLMYSHEVNEWREEKGLMSINSLWFYGAGRLPLKHPPSSREQSLRTTEVDASEIKDCSLCSNDVMFKGLAEYTGCEYLDCSSVEEYIKHLDETGVSKNILHLTALGHAVNYTDVTIWSRALEKLLEQWIYPLMSYTNKHKTSFSLYPCNGRGYRFSSSDRWKIWRHGEVADHIKSF